MIEWIQANPALAGGIALLLVAALWLLLARRRKPRHVQREYRDVLSEGAGPAQRNTALIDAPSAAAVAGGAVSGGAGASVAAVVDAVAEAIAPSPAIPEAPAAAASATAAPDGDDLTRIKGLGPKLRARLADLGVTTFAQVAAWSEADIAAIDAQLGNFAGRPTRDNWVEQARLLIEGDTAAYEAKFGKL